MASAAQPEAKEVDKLGISDAQKEAEDLKKLIAEKQASKMEKKEGEAAATGEEKKEEEKTEEEKEKEEAAAQKKADEEHEAKMLEEAIEKYGKDVTVAMIMEKVKERQTNASDEKPLSNDELDKAIEEMSTFYQARMWAPALERCIDSVAIIESLNEEQLKPRKGFMGSYDTDVVIIKHNLGAVLHQLGHFEAATHFYKAGMAEVEKFETPNCLVKCMCDSQMREQRLNFIKSMIELAEKKEKMPATKHLDSEGSEQDFQRDEFKEKLGQAKTILGLDPPEDEEGEEGKESAPDSASAPAAAPAAAEAKK